MNKKDLKMEHITGKEQMISTDVSSSNSTGSHGSTTLSEATTKRLVTYDGIIGYDYQGWPTYHLRVISFLRALGVPENIIKQIPENILKTHISTGTDACTNCNMDLEKGEIYVF